jgi:hypothetical protein
MSVRCAGDVHLCGYAAMSPNFISRTRLRCTVYVALHV